MAKKRTRRTMKIGGKRKKRAKSAKKSVKRGKKLNPFFKVMLEAKKKKADSFMYNGKKYVAKKKGKLIIYKCA